MAMRMRRRKTRRVRPEDRVDDLVFRIESVNRRWFRGPRWDSTMRRQDGLETSDHLVIVGVACQPNEIKFERVQLTIYSRSPEEVDRELLGICDRVRGDRGLLTAYLWFPLPEVMQLAPSLVGRHFVEIELRVRGFFRSKGRVQSIQFKTQMSAYEDWAIEVQEQGWPGEPVDRIELMG